MSVLEKLSGVEIKPDSRISEANRRCCAVHQLSVDSEPVRNVLLPESPKYS